MRFNLTLKYIEECLVKGTIRGFNIIGKPPVPVKQKIRGKGQSAKYGNKVTIVDSIPFDSKKEAQRYKINKLRQSAGEIKDLKLQQEFKFVINDKKIASYFADFTFIVVETGEFVVEDVKSPATRKKASYRLKYRLMQSIHNITIQEV